jgi:DNA transformation protein and related proteins
VNEAAIRDVFASLAPIRMRRMFGGTGIYADDVMFALEAYGELYLKTDAISQPAFRDAGSRAFVYEKDGRRVAMSYWLLPEEAHDDPDAAAAWARLGLEAARRAKGRGGRTQKPGRNVPG